MSEVIIDTNVAVVANRQNSDVVSNCLEECIRFLTEAYNNDIVLIDSGGEIVAEYARALKRSRPHQLGAQFLFQIFQQRYNPSRVKLIDLDKTQEGDFADFPNSPERARFDPSDRKFAALAKKTGTAVTNATDSDWAEHHTALVANGINVIFLCGNDTTKWFNP